MHAKSASRSAPSAATAPAPRQRALLGQISDMDLRLLQVFKSVAECGGMAAAELELNIGASTVSRHIKDLETRLGLTLCRRGRAGFALTAEGQRVYDETLRLLSAVDAFRSGIDDIHQRMGGRLDVAVFDKTASNPAARIGAGDCAVYRAGARRGAADACRVDQRHRARADRRALPGRHHPGAPPFAQPGLHRPVHREHAAVLRPRSTRCSARTTPNSPGRRCAPGSLRASATTRPTWS